MLRLELIALYAFAVVLPNFEAPKNLLWALYAVVWIANRWRARDFGGPWNAWDSLIAAWIASVCASAACAGIHDSEWMSSFDILRYGSLLWFLTRSRYADAVLWRLLGCIVFGTFAALLRGYFDLHFYPRTDGQRRYLGLNSVGHVNHSAIYLAIVFGLAVAWLRAGWKAASAATRVCGMAVCLLFAASLFVMESRATVGAGFIVAMSLFLVPALRAGAYRRAGMVALCAGALVAAIFVAQPEVVRKNADRLHENLFLAHRDAIWRTGLIAWKQFPAFGVGTGNYGRINLARIEAWSAKSGALENAGGLMPQAHAHSLYVNTLVERGAVGLAVLLAVLVAWGLALLRSIPVKGTPELHFVCWGGALSAWLVTVLVGFVNTTLHHEHALVSMLLLGIWLRIRFSNPAVSGAQC